MELVTLLIAFLALAFSIGGPLGHAWIRRREIQEERKEARLQWKRNFLLQTMQELIELRAELQYLQDKDIDTAERYSEIGVQDLLELQQRRETAYGKAFAYMLTIPDKEIRGHAGQVMEQVNNPNQNEKLEAINKAIIALGNLIQEANSQQELVIK
jgi:hypothetical protein